MFSVRFGFDLNLQAFNRLRDRRHNHFLAGLQGLLGAANHDEFLCLVVDTHFSAVNDFNGDFDQFVVGYGPNEITRSEGNCGEGEKLTVGVAGADLDVDLAFDEHPPDECVDVVVIGLNDGVRDGDQRRDGS